MQLDFHYYATYCAAWLAGYSHEESAAIGYSSQFTDVCSVSLLSKLRGPKAAATTQLQLELMEEGENPVSLQRITRIWSSFHFLPGDLYADVPKGGKKYKQKYRMICDVNSDLLVETVELARGKGEQAIGLAMHVLADTWAHRYFAGTPALVINNTNYHFLELVPEGDGFTERRVEFHHNPMAADDPEKGHYVNSLYQRNENSIMNLGHGRAGHFPDYSFARYKYLPAWDDYREMLKDNPEDYYHAFCQMIYALKNLREDGATFEKEQYDEVSVAAYEARVRSILEKRQTDASKDWKKFGEELSGREIEDFDAEKYEAEYMDAAEDKKDDTFLGKYFLASLRQKSMVTNRVYHSGNLLAGVSAEYDENRFRGIRDFEKLIKDKTRGTKDE